MSILTLQEFSRRMRAAQAVVRDSRLDAILVFSTESEPAAVRYFADYWPSFETTAVLIPAEGEPALLIGPESLTYASSRSRIAKIIQLMDFRESSQPDYPGSRLPKWSDIAAQYKLKKIGLVNWYLFPYAMMTELAGALGGVEHIVPADALIRPLFMKKSAEEIACLRAAALASEAGFKAILENIKPGMTESELCGIATAAMTAAGAEAAGYPIWCCSGPNSDQAISRPTMRKVQCGEIIHFSIGAKVEGYSASIGRPVVLGQCPDDIRKFMQVGLDAANMTFDEMRAGRKSGDVATKIHDYIRRQGYGDAILYGPAHGCGQMECEYPFLETSSEYMLEADMTFMQDMFLHRGGMGFRWEDGLLVKASGPAEMLSSYGRRINIL
ncbi:MAG: Xaa-Pro peptidase family protein [Lentisphaeria bacterium]|nr:Xaa-Pro peptidase family protein [Lentisphaeria bacterium]